MEAPNSFALFLWWWSWDRFQTLGGLSVTQPNRNIKPRAIRDFGSNAPCWKSWYITNNRTWTKPNRQLQNRRSHHGSIKIVAATHALQTTAVETKHHQLTQGVSVANCFDSISISFSDRTVWFRVEKTSYKRIKECLLSAFNKIPSSRIPRGLTIAQNWFNALSCKLYLNNFTIRRNSVRLMAY